MEHQVIVREQVLALLRGGNAHMTFDEAVADFPMEFINRRPPNVPYSLWHLLEHVRFAQLDILDFLRNASYKAPNWPDDYWPDLEQQANPEQWRETIRAFKADLEALQEIAADSRLNLEDEIPHAPGYTYIREFLLVADHNAYHIGEFGILRQVMGTWPA
jgi:hypothetical protein